MWILYGVLIYSFGLFAGFLLRAWIGSRSSYTGTIHISKEMEKTVYLLELEDYPDEIRFKKEVVFKVDSSQYKEAGVAEKA
jgi:hypothetical protein